MNTMTKNSLYKQKINTLVAHISASVSEFEEVAKLVSPTSAYLSTRFENLAQQRGIYTEQLCKQFNIEYNFKIEENSDPRKFLKSGDMISHEMVKEILKETVTREEQLVDELQNTQTAMKGISEETIRIVSEICEHAEGAVQIMNRQITEALESSTTTD
ncbi:hypothetical protein QEH59_10630 [Coraliomargarita sp. SDUM461004]|uniref:DUF2383 domain-containing protein n=1 Tax=Thalassobacterium sedimentorum TaxID=3041258 RepID=A0ABU1AL19_9BACT|nr:hypothetical protein [Coraliomargarita sp. SDUM461004]MDQ8194883.1 hypothetical protein [Coraliomargarita sp. SDUM461004]